jgi:hypothetical protein
LSSYRPSVLPLSISSGRRTFYADRPNAGSSGADVQFDDAYRRDQFRRIEIARPIQEVNAKPSLVQVRSDIETVIQESLRILDLDDDWDKDGASSYEPETLNRAIGFVRAHDVAAARMGYRLVPPRILPGPDASIDILWRAGAFELLINFPANPASEVTFYGDDKRGSVIRGTLRSIDTPPVSLVPWLITP